MVFKQIYAEIIMLIDQLPDKNDGPDKEQALFFNNSSQEIVNNSELFEIEEIKYDGMPLKILQVPFT